MAVAVVVLMLMLMLKVVFNVYHQPTALFPRVLRLRRAAQK